MSDVVDTQGGAGAADDGNALIRDLRAQLKETKAALKAVDPDAIRAQVLAETNREATASSLMDKAGFPKLGNLFASQVEGELNAEAAAEYLSTLGLVAEKPTDGAPSGAPLTADGLTPAQIAAEVERLATVGAEMGSVGKVDVPIDELLASARTSDDVTQIMRDSGLTVRGH